MMRICFPRGTADRDDRASGFSDAFRSQEELTTNRHMNRHKGRTAKLTSKGQANTSEHIQGHLQQQQRRRSDGSLEAARLVAVCVHGMWHWTGLGLLFGASLNLESHSEGFVKRLSVEAHSGYPADTQSAIGAAARVSNRSCSGGSLNCSRFSSLVG